MAFRFGLAAVLRFRESIEKREELALQQVQLQMAQTQHAIDALTAQIANAQQARNHAMREPLPAVHLQAMLLDADAAVERRKALQDALHKLEQLRVQRMQIYQAAHRGRQMLSDIRAREQEAYDQERVRLQQKVLDDIFGSRHQRGPS